MSGTCDVGRRALQRGRQGRRRGKLDIPPVFRGVGACGVAEVSKVV